MRKPANPRIINLISFSVFITSTVFGQVKYEPESVSTADYGRAESFLSASTSPMIFKASVRPEWAETHRFWYKNSLPEGTEYIMVDALKKVRQPAFDHEKLANALLNHVVLLPPRMVTGRLLSKITICGWRISIQERRISLPSMVRV